MLSTLTPMLRKAQKEGYGVPMFDVMDTDSLCAIINACEKLASPVIIAYFEGFIPFVDVEVLGPMLVAAAKNAKVPVCVHLDHGSSYQMIVRALKCGFTSVMIDASTMSYEENVRQTREVVRLARIYGADVEAEIGHVAGQEFYNIEDERHIYTETSDAVRFIRDTEADALAVSIGSVHGVYRQAPRLSFDRLMEIRNAVDTPLVLHGGSGISDDDFKRLIACGITKLNIFTDLTIAALKASQTDTSDCSSQLYFKQKMNVMDRVREAVTEKVMLFGSNNKI